MIVIKSAIFEPMVALMVWTMAMWLWLYVTRVPAILKAKIDVFKWTGGTGKDLDGIVPDRAQWVAHNYNHLHEAPTLFYAVCLLLAFTGNGGGLSTKVAWAYVGLRALHSIVQATINKIALRFSLFVLSSLCLMALVYRAAEIIFIRNT